MKPPTHYFNRARECRRYAIALALVCIACAVAFGCLDRPALSGVESLLPLLLATVGLATGLGALNEFRELMWWKRMGELEAAYHPLERI